MGLNLVTAGELAPDIFNVIIEISANSDPIKYEVDKKTSVLFVDRFISSTMRYPCNYGYIPRTLAADGDPVDVLVITPFPLMPGVGIRARALGVLKMSDESGVDAKILAVPDNKTSPMYHKWQELKDVPALFLEQVQYFFESYKKLEPGKWVKIDGWSDCAAAQKEITQGMARYKA